MADGVPITPGVGVTVASDDAGAAGQVQIIKLAQSANGSASPATLDADGLLVNLGANNDVTVSGVATEATLAALLTELGQKLEAGQSVELGAATLAALETITAVISGAVALDSATLAALESITIGTALPVGNNNIGDVDVASLPALPAGTNNIGDVDVLTLPNVTLAAGTNTNEVVGDVAEDAALAGNPVRQGARASTAIPTAMSADGDVVTPWADRNGAAITRPRPSDTGTLTNVNDTATSTTLLSANMSRLSVVLHNDSPSTLYLKYGTTASTTSYSYKIAPDAHWEMPYLYTGRIDGIWSADASGAVRLTELT